MRRRALLLATPALVASALVAPALAQPWRPERPVEILVGFAPGGASDLDARSYAAGMPAYTLLADELAAPTRAAHQEAP